MNISITVPCGDMVHTGFCMDLVKAVAYHGAKYPDDELLLHHRHGTLLPEQRQELFKLAVEEGADYIVTIDSDMRFPKNLFERLIGHDMPVVAANCAKRRRPIGPTAQTLEDGQIVSVYPDDYKKGLEQVVVVGTAVMGLKADVLGRLEWPWFDLQWSARNQKWMGEDTFFCARLRDAEIPLMIDHDLSWEVGHAGVYEYSMKDVLAEREMMETGAWR